jgi:hypothetical protein
MSGGDFFAVDAGEWAELCQRGRINKAIAYLVMARGTGGDNRTTSWSTHAVEIRTGVSRAQAKAAIEGLVQDGHARRERSGKRPRYKLRAGVSPDWIWLPNAIVDGVAGETPPIERIRQSASLPALQLFVELYHAQNLADFGGVDWRHLRLRYERRKIGQRGQFVVWGFSTKTETVWPKEAPFVAGRSIGKKGEDGRLVFWDALAILTDTGLAEYVGHVIDSDTEDAAIVHPYAMATGEPEERAVAEAAHAAAREMLTDQQREQAEADELWLLPAERHRQEVQLVGILRLRYRARTASTARWYDPNGWTGFAEGYREMAERESAF